jgi:hypothetical protein
MRPMKTIGRNDPCPCGSSKKYKKCCLATTEAHDHEYRHWLNIEQNLIPRLTAHAFSLHDKETFEAAWCEFNCSDDDEMIQPDSPMNSMFMPWFIFSWLYEIDVKNPDDFDAMTNAQSFLNLYESELTEDELTFIERAMCADYSLCEVIALRPGEGMTLRDLFTLAEFYVDERLASQTLARGEIIYCATMEIRGFKTNLATAPYALRPTTKRKVIELRNEILDAAGVERISDVELVTEEEDIRAFYLEHMDEMFLPPSLVNADGESLVFHKLHFDLKSVDKAFHLLKDLSRDDEEQLMRGATIADGRIISVEIPVSGDSDDDAMLGVLTLTQGELVAKVTSEQRALWIRELVEDKLGELVTYRTTSEVSFDEEVERLWEQSLAEAAGDRQFAQDGSESPVGSEIFDGPDSEFDDDEDIFGDVLDYEPDSTGFEPNFSTLDLDDPEIQELMKRGVGSRDDKLDENDPQVQELLRVVAAKHWSTWFDIPIPALDDMTPREAAKTEDGRDLLESLLLEYEANNQRDPSNPSKPDVPHLRRELGME